MLVLVQVETLFQAMQRSAKRPASTARQKLAVLDLKRATAVGIRMSRLRYVHCSLMVLQRLCMMHMHRQYCWPSYPRLPETHSIFCGISGPLPHFMVSGLSVIAASCVCAYDWSFVCKGGY